MAARGCGWVGRRPGCTLAASQAVLWDHSASHRSAAGSSHRPLAVSPVLGRRKPNTEGKLYRHLQSVHMSVINHVSNPTCNSTSYQKRHSVTSLPPVNTHRGPVPGPPLSAGAEAGGCLGGPRQVRAEGVVGCFVASVTAAHVAGLDASPAGGGALIEERGEVGVSLGTCPARHMPKPSESTHFSCSGMISFQSQIQVML